MSIILGALCIAFGLMLFALVMVKRDHDELASEVSLLRASVAQDAAVIQSLTDRHEQLQQQVANLAASIADDELFQTLGRGWTDDPTAYQPNYRREPFEKPN